MTPTLDTSPLPVAIIGAGLAGLSCAQALVQAGQVVHLFDKSRGPAGRMSTRRSTDADGHGAWQCDHGAQYFTARDPVFMAEVQRWLAAGVAARWDGRMASLDGTQWSALGTPLDRFVGTPRMTSPAGWLVQQLGGQAQCTWQTTVQQVHSDRDGWLLTTAEHGTLTQRYGAVVLAVPAPQAVPLLSPVNAAGAQLAASAQMRGCWAVMVRCATPVALPIDGAFINTGPLRWIARDRSKPGRIGPDTWLLHASPEWSEAHIEDDAATVTATLLQAFADLGGPDAGSDAGADATQLQATAHRWRYADTEPALTHGCWWDGSARLGMCGDWLNGGKVEGAWLSGQALAQQARG